MCGKPSVDTSYQDFSRQEAERARAEEEARQARIAEGMKQIAAVFEGGEYAPLVETPQPVQVTAPPPAPAPQTPAEKHDQPRQSGENAPWTPPAPVVTTGPQVGDWIVPEVTERGPVQTYQGMQPVLDQRRAAMEGFYIPQLDNQFADARDQLTYALARSGQLTSSTAGNKQGDLAEMFALNRAKIDADIASDIAATQTRMNQQRQSLEAGLRASGDQTAASNAALQSAVTFREDSPTLNPLGNIFYGLAEGIGAVKQGYETGRIKKLATPNPLNKGTGRVVRT